VFAQREVVNADEVQFISTRLATGRVPRIDRSVELPPTPAFVSTPAPQAELPPAPADTGEPPVAMGAAGAMPPPDPLGALTSSVASPAAPEVVTPRNPQPAEVRVEARPVPVEDHPLVLRIPVGTPLAEAERLLIIKTLEVSDGNKQRAARILGISRRGLYTKLAAYGEHVPAEDAADNGVNETPNA
jgi:hypothetical protein